MFRCKARKKPNRLTDTISISKDNATARRRCRKRIVPYAEEADDAANKVSQRKRIDILLLKQLL
jgi:hypothetical protein